VTAGWLANVQAGHTRGTGPLAAGIEWAALFSIADLVKEAVELGLERSL
jgi:hypothetical protein